MSRYTVQHVSRASSQTRYLLQNAAVRGGLAARTTVTRLIKSGTLICARCDGNPYECSHTEFIRGLGDRA